MSVKVFLEGASQKELEDFWQLYTDVTCEHCSKEQAYANYLSHGSSCFKCGNKEEIPILIVGKLPIILNNKNEVDEAQGLLESIIVASNMLDYEEIKYRIMTNTQPSILIIFQSSSENKLIKILFFMDKYGKIIKTSLRVGEYMQWSNREKLESNNIIDILNKVLEAI